MISHEKHTSQKSHKKCLHLDRISLFIPRILGKKKTEEESDENPWLLTKFISTLSFNWQGKIFPTFQQNKEINF